MSNKTCLLVEYAKTGRSTCRYCSRKIREGTVRMTLMVKTNWYHEYCFIKVRRVPNVRTIKIYNRMRQVDKDRIQNLIENYTGVAMSMETPKTYTNLQTLNNFSIEYSKTDRITCRYCKKTINEGSMQVFHNTEICTRNRIQNCWRHLYCFVAERDVLGYIAGGKDLPGFYTLKRKDQLIVKRAIKSKTANEVPTNRNEDHQEMEIEMLIDHQVPPPECDDMEGPNTGIPIPPLKNLQFVIYGNLDNHKKRVTTRILQLGGLVTNKLIEAHAAVVFTEQDLKKRDAQMSEILKTGIMVVKESFFYLINPTETVEEALRLIISYNIAPSILPKPVQKLIVQIFNIKLMNRALEEFQLDIDRTPILSKNQIIEEYHLLVKLLELIKNGSASAPMIVDASNRFCTKIPHVVRQPLLDNVEAIKQKINMLDNLLEMGIAFNLLKIQGDIAIPIDRYYDALKADITPVSPDIPDEYNLILEYINSSHVEGNSNYRLEVKQVFKVDRYGEEESYRPCRAFRNCRLLWHGSRLSNMVGILSEGLRIMPPPEGPSKSYTLCKGIHFSDMLSQAANSCYASPDNPTGIVLLCEVALGTMQRCYNTESIPKLTPKQHSTWVMGRIQPDPAFSRILPDGTMVPLGRPVLRESKSGVMHNDFIIYFEDQKGRVQGGVVPYKFGQDRT